MARNPSNLMIPIHPPIERSMLARDTRRGDGCSRLCLRGDEPASG